MFQELNLLASNRWPSASDVSWGVPGSYDALHYAAATLAAGSGLPHLQQQQQPLLSLPPAQLQPTAHHHHHSASGCLAAFSIVFLGEFGDKTFFTAALLAIRVGRLVSFTGSMLALAAMSLIGVAIGTVFARTPPTWCSGLPVGEILGVLLLVVFGVGALRKAATESAAVKQSNLAANNSSSSQQDHAGRHSDDGSLRNSSSVGSHCGLLSPQHSADDEFAEAEQAVAAATSRGLLQGDSRRALLSSVLDVAAVMFLAEWGDRSMLATVALGAAQNPWGVAVGATAAYAAATGLAVLGGALAAKHVSEQTLDAISGVLFLVFAAASVKALF